jgi:hypothetical protein
MNLSITPSTTRFWNLFPIFIISIIGIIYSTNEVRFIHALSTSSSTSPSLSSAVENGGDNNKYTTTRSEKTTTVSDRSAGDDEESRIIRKNIAMELTSMSF